MITCELRCNGSSFDCDAPPRRMDDNYILGIDRDDNVNGNPSSTRADMSAQLIGAGNKSQSDIRRRQRRSRLDGQSLPVAGVLEVQNSGYRKSYQPESCHDRADGNNQPAC